MGNVQNNITHYTTTALAVVWLQRTLDCDLFCLVEWHYWNTYSTQTLSSTTPTVISAGQTLTIVGNQISNDSGTAVFNNNTPLGSNIDPNAQNNYSSTFTNSSTVNPSNPNTPSINLGALANSPLYNNNPNSESLTNAAGNTINFTYATETNPLFTNNNTFLSSDYFLQHLDYSPGRQIILAGDPTSERQLVLNQIQQAEMSQYLSSSPEDALYQNGLTWLQNNLSVANGGTNPSVVSDYQFGQLLTQDQINNLTQDMVIPVYQMVNGQQELVPQVYFCNATLQAKKQGTQTGGEIYSTGGSVNLIATGTNASITNDGYISGQNGVQAISQGSFTNTGGTINANTGDIDIQAQSVNIADQSVQASGTSNQIQNVSKLTAGNGSVDITSNNDLNLESTYVAAGNNVSLTSTQGSVNLTQNSSSDSMTHYVSTDNGSGDSSDYSSQTVANVIKTGNKGNSGNVSNSDNNTALLIQQQQNNEQITQLQVQLAGGNTSIQSQIDSLNASNAQIKQELQANANTGSITINAAQNINILASQNVTDNSFSFNAMSFVGTANSDHVLQSQTTVSPLLSSNNININADGGNGNINLLSAIITGEGNLNLNGNVSMQSLQDLYYQYDFSQATSMNLGALLGMLLAAVVIGAVTGGAGALALGAIGAATVSVGTAVVGAAIASSTGVALQLGITAAIDHQNGGAAATKDMQSGYSDYTTKQYQGLVGNSLLFGGDININSTTPASVDQATQISSNNITQTAQTNESASFKEEHKTIGPDWNQLMTDAAINGVVSGVTVAAGPLIEAGVSKLGSFVSRSFGLSKAGDELVDATIDTAAKQRIVVGSSAERNSLSKYLLADNKNPIVPNKVFNSDFDIDGVLNIKAIDDPLNGVSRGVDQRFDDISLFSDTTKSTDLKVRNLNSNGGDSLGSISGTYGQHWELGFQNGTSLGLDVAKPGFSNLFGGSFRIGADAIENLPMYTLKETVSYSNSLIRQAGSLIERQYIQNGSTY